MFRRKIPEPQGPKRRVSNGGPLSISDRYLERGLHLYDKKKYADALADLDAAIRESPNFAELYVTRGLILYQLERDDEATDEFTYALSRDPRHWLAHYLLGMIAIRRENYDLAVEEFSKAQRYVPERPEVLYARSIAHYHKGNLQLAFLDADSAHQLLENNAPDSKLRKTAKSLASRFSREKKGKK